MYLDTRVRERALTGLPGVAPLFPSTDCPNPIVSLFPVGGHSLSLFIGQREKAQKLQYPKIVATIADPDATLSDPRQRGAEGQG